MYRISPAANRGSIVCGSAAERTRDLRRVTFRLPARERPCWADAAAAANATANATTNATANACTTAAGGAGASAGAM